MRGSVIQEFLVCELFSCVGSFDFRGVLDSTGRSFLYLGLVCIAVWSTKG